MSLWRVGEAVRTLLFLGGFYVYLWGVVDLRLIYYNWVAVDDFPAFFRGVDFFREFVSYPGGVVEYISAFLSQLFYVSWAGALVATVQVYVLCVLTGLILSRAGLRGFRMLRFFPGILLLPIYGQYTHHLTAVTALSVSLAFVWVYLRVASGKEVLSIVWFAVLFSLLYFVAGGASLVFLCVCGIYEVVFRRRVGLAVFCSLLVVGISYVETVVLFNASLSESFGYLSPTMKFYLSLKVPKQMVTVVYILYSFAPLMVLTSGIWRLLVRGSSASCGKGSEGEASEPGGDEQASVRDKLTGRFGFGKLRGGTLPVVRWVIGSGIVLFVAGAVGFISLNERMKTVLAVNYYASERMWPRVIEIVRRQPSNNYHVVHLLDQALYHTGRLGDDMFCYPQHPNALFLAGTSYASAGADWQRYRIYFDMGLVNLCEHTLVESLEVLGYRPMILKRLALLNMIRGRSEVARKYLNLLDRTLFYAGWAEDYLARLEADPNLMQDEEIQRLRSMMLATEQDYSLDAGPERNLRALLDANKQNRMAFEYLMAWYLLIGEMEKFVANIGRLNDFGYERIPRAYEEALLLYMHNKRSKVDLGKYRISRESRQRFNGFLQVYLWRYDGDTRATIRELAARYSDTYFFYAVLYGREGKPG